MQFVFKRTQAVVADLANSPAIDGDPRLGLRALERKVGVPCIYQRFPQYNHGLYVDRR